MIYRRIKFGDIVEGIEIVLVDEPSRQIASDDLFNGDSIKVCFLELEGETLIYDVEVPKLLRVKPPDLRRFAYDHKKVGSLVANCVNDNSYKYIFEPLNESLLENLQQELFVALQDLNSVLDLLSVECNLTPQDPLGGISVRVEYELKNGELVVFVVPLNFEKKATVKKKSTVKKKTTSKRKTTAKKKTYAKKKTTAKKKTSAKKK